MFRTLVLLTYLPFLFSSCLFSSDEQPASKQLVKDFYLQDHSLIRKVKEANTYAIIVDGALGIINTIGWDKNYILIEQNLDTEAGPLDVAYYIIDLRNYIPKDWDQTKNLYKTYSLNEFDIRRKALGVPDSIKLKIADIHSLK